MLFRSGDDATTSKAASKPKTPTRAGEEAIDTFVESLRDEVKPILLKTAKAYLRDAITGYNKMDTYTRMNDDAEFIPRSARINFTIQSNKLTSELESFQDVKDETEEIVKETRLKLRSKILKSLDIEIKNRAERFAVDSVKATNLCTRIAIVEKDANDNLELLTTRATFEAMAAIINEATNIDEGILNGSLENAYPDPLNLPGANINQPQIPQDLLDRSKELFTAIFVIPMREWKKATEDAKIRNKLRAINNEAQKKATEETAMAIEAKPNVSESNLADLIKEAVSKETAALQKQVEELKKSKIRPHPKESRGRLSGASEKEKQRKKSDRKKKVRFQKRNESADDDDSASSNPKSILRRPRYHSSPTPKRQQQKNQKQGKNRRQNRN